MEEYYSEGNVAHLTDISSEKMKQCELILKDIIDNIQGKIFLVSSLERNNPI